MSYPARVFRILIASPSDVSEEREIAVKTIQDWNDLNSSERQIVLLPLRWESHSAPEYGKRPQEVINRQVVEHSDLLVGIFWTRIGSPTGVADSGTLEEIERVANQGKPVMLYFSQVKQDPDRLNLEQLARLREFKKKTFPKALIETYATQIEFRDKLARQLEIQLRSLLAAEAESDGGGTLVRPVTDIQLAFADPESGARLGDHISHRTTFLEVQGLDEIPDFESPKKKSRSDTHSSLLFYGGLDSENKDYYRDLVQYLIRRSFFRPIRFWLKNAGGVGARDVYADLRIGTDGPPLKALSGLGAVLNPPKQRNDLVIDWPARTSTLDEGDGELQQLGSTWTTSIELQALQPQRELSPRPDLLLGVDKSAVVTVSARVFADTLSEPVAKDLEIDWTVETKQVRATDLLEEFQPSSRKPD
jgi:hypothetical protein